MDSRFFLNMIKNLRAKEEVFLYANILEISTAEEEEVIAFLQQEFSHESLNYPFVPPSFDANAAIWSAKLVYLSCQLLLYRENKPSELEAILPKYPHEITASAIISADLCLRFLPIITTELKLADPEDVLVKLLEDVLSTWHYSGIAYLNDASNLNFEILSNSDILNLMYVDRIIENRKLKFALHSFIQPQVESALGMYASDFWKEFKNEMKEI
jgi:hypothetical protein